MASAGNRKKFANSNLNTLLGAPKEVAKANYGPAVRSGGVVKPVAKPKGLVSLGKAPAASSVNARKGAAWNQLEEDAKKRAEEESARKRDDTRPDWAVIDFKDLDKPLEREDEDDEEIAEFEKARDVKDGWFEAPAPDEPSAGRAIFIERDEDHAPESVALREKELTSLWADQNDLDEEDAATEEVGVLDVNVPRTALVINISYVLKRLNGCCSLNQLAKALKSFKEKTGMSLEVFLRSNPRTFKLEGRIVYLLDRDGDKWQPPKQEPAAGGPGGTDAGHPERSKGQAKGKEAKGRGGGEGRRGKAMMKGDPPPAKGETGKGRASKGHGHNDEWSEWSWNSNGHWAQAWDERTQPEWKALQRKASRWKAS